MRLVYRALTITFAFTACSTATVHETAVAGTSCNQMAIIGDSLIANGNQALHRQFPTAIINARGGRLVSDGWEAAQGIKESNPLVDCWIIALGTNDISHHLDVSTMQTAIDHLRSTLVGRVWWVLPQFAPAAQLDPTVFDYLVPANVIRISTNPVLADFIGDGIHRTPEGYEHRADALRRYVAD